MNKILLMLAAALAAAMLSGCATSNTAYIEAQKAALVRDSDARVAEATAIVAVAGKLDAGGASAYLVAVAMRGTAGSAASRPAIERPRDWLDYLTGVTGAVGGLARDLGAIAVPIVTVREAGKTQRAGFDRDVQVEQSRQVGETARIATVGQIATSVATAPRPPSTVVTVTAGGDSIVGGGTIDRRDCRTRAGNGADGPAYSGATAPAYAGIVGLGGPGGNASGGC